MTSIKKKKNSRSLESTLNLFKNDKIILWALKKYLVKEVCDLAKKAKEKDILIFRRIKVGTMVSFKPGI